MKVGRWSTAAGSNNAATPDGWPEGQLPSTVNDCAREMMAAIRIAFLDLAFVDQDLSPSYITASSFSVPGNQTSAIHIGRRLKIFDATAGVQQIIYATVQSVSFTSVTTVHIESDSGSLTSSLSSFGISIIPNVNNPMPRDSDMTISSLAVAGNMSISGAAAMNGAVQMASTLSVSGAATMNGTLTVSGDIAAVGRLLVGQTAVAANISKAWFRFVAGNPPTLIRGFNVASVSRSAVGIYRVTLSTPLSSPATYCFLLTVDGFYNVSNLSASTTTVKIGLTSGAGGLTDTGLTINGTFFE